MEGRRRSAGCEGTLPRWCEADARGSPGPRTPAPAPPRPPACSCSSRPSGRPLPSAPAPCRHPGLTPSPPLSLFRHLPAGPWAPCLLQSLQPGPLFLKDFSNRPLAFSVFMSDFPLEVHLREAGISVTLHRRRPRGRDSAWFSTNSAERAAEARRGACGRPVTQWQGQRDCPLRRGCEGLRDSGGRAGFRS